ncbi:hypothetical protein [Alienimonas sp. DA493]|uniref:hypothetical protein n=1 Tax=Alienimonas sp. DA493 TaxID=3373605 RepID=UPI003755382C
MIQSCCCGGVVHTCSFHRGTFPDDAKNFLPAGFYVPYPAQFYLSGIHVRRLNPDHFVWSRDHLRNEREFGYFYDDPVSATGLRTRSPPGAGDDPEGFYPHPITGGGHAAGELPLHYPNPHPLVERLPVWGPPEDRGESPMELLPSTGRDLFDAGYHVPDWHGRVPSAAAPGSRQDFSWMRHAGGAHLDNYYRVLAPDDQNAAGVVKCDDWQGAPGEARVDVWTSDVEGDYTEGGGTGYVDSGGNYVVSEFGPGCRNAKYDGISGRYCEENENAPGSTITRTVRRWDRHDVPDLPPADDGAGGFDAYDADDYAFWTEFRLSHGLGTRWRDKEFCSYSHSERADHGAAFMQDKESSWPRQAQANAVDRDEKIRKAVMATRDDCDWPTASPETTEVDLFVAEFPQKVYELDLDVIPSPMKPEPSDSYEIEYDAILRVRHTYLDLNVCGAIRHGSDSLGVRAEVYNPKAPPEAVAGDDRYVRVYTEGHTRRWVTCTDYYGFRFKGAAFQSQVSTGGYSPFADFEHTFDLGVPPDTGPLIVNYPPTSAVDRQAVYDLHAQSVHQQEHRVSFWPRDRNSQGRLWHYAADIRQQIANMDLRPEFLYGTVSVRNKIETRYADFFQVPEPAGHTSTSDPYWQEGDEWELVRTGGVVDIATAEFPDAVVAEEQTYSFQTQSNTWVNGPYPGSADSDGMGYGDGLPARFVNFAYPSDVGSGEPFRRSYDVNLAFDSAVPPAPSFPLAGYWTEPTPDEHGVLQAPYVAGSTIRVSAEMPN